MKRIYTRNDIKEKNGSAQELKLKRASLVHAPLLFSIEMLCVRTKHRKQLKDRITPHMNLYES